MKIEKQITKNIKIKDLAFLNELGAEIVEFYPKNDTLTGKLYVTGSYRSSKTEIDKLISEDIIFNILLDSNNINIIDVDCDKFDYTIVEGQGISIEYNISISYELEEIGVTDGLELPKTEVETQNERLENITKDEIDENEVIDNKTEVIDNKTEVIKEKITSEIEEKLSSKLEVIDDNLPSEQEVTRNIKNVTSTIKVIYYNNEKEIDKISHDYNCSLERLYKENKNNNMEKYHRLIISNVDARKN